MHFMLNFVKLDKERLERERKREREREREREAQRITNFVDGGKRAAVA